MTALADPDWLRRIWRASLTPHSLLTLEELLDVVPGEAAARHDWIEEHLRPAGSLAGATLYR